jgi:hypothetical protein
MKTHLQSRVLASILASALCIAGAALAPLPAYAQTFKVLYAFTGSPDGGNPVPGLALDATGNIYGTTLFGGVPGNPGTDGTYPGFSPKTGIQKPNPAGNV